jgi:small GTP-binding protein
MTESRNFRFKIAVVGDSDVGKTSLMKKFTRVSFDSEYDKTIGFQFSRYEREKDGKKFRLMFWDICGSDEFRFLRPSGYKNSGGAIIVFSLEDNKMGRESFKNIPMWHKEVIKYRGDIPVYVFANKMDLVDEDKLDETSIMKMVEENGLRGYYFTSAISGDTPIKAFNDIIEVLYNKYKNIPSQEVFNQEKVKRRKRRR